MQDESLAAAGLFALQRGIPRVLLPLRCLAVALLRSDGTLIHGNSGFQRLVDAPAQPNQPLNCARFFLQPRFADLLEPAPPPEGAVVHEGPLTIGRANGAGQGLRGLVFRQGDTLVLICERDADEVERLSRTLLELNEELTEMHREVVRTNHQIQENEARLRKLMLTDDLTGLPNRRHFHDRAAMELERARRYGHPLCLVSADIDHFKAVNDRHGHDVGDRVLEQFAKVLSAGIRTTDFAARTGGEEFSLLLPETPAETAQVLLDRARQALAQIRVEPLETPISASFGVAELRADDDLDTLLKRADQALYQSKRSGRDQVTVAAD